MPTFTGTPWADQFSGGPGDDSLNGLSGADTINGLAGNDTIDGGAGGDSITDSSGNDLLLGGAGDDAFTADHRLSDTATIQAVTIDGGDGDDTIFAYQRFAPFGIPTSQETFTASMFGGAGNDFFRLYGDFDATVNGGDGNDDVGIVGLWQKSVQITLGAGSDIVTYNPKSLGWTGVVTITDFQPGNGGDRLLSPLDQGLLSNWNTVTNPFSDGHLRLVQQGADTLLQIDRDGTDSSYTFQDFVRFQNTNVSAFKAFNLFDFTPSGTTAGPESVTGAAGSEQLSGDSGDDVIQGLAGDDTIFGDAGDDSIDGGDGADTIDGGPGNDSVTGGAGDDVIRVLVGADTVSGGDGNDVVTSNTFGAVVLNGDAGNDTLVGGPGYATLSGGAGDDALRAIDGGILNGGDGNDTLATWVGPDLITGGPGANVILVEHNTASVPLYTGGGVLGLDAITDWTALDKFTFTNEGVQVAGAFVVDTAADLATAVARADQAVVAGATFIAMQVGADVIVFADITHNPYHAEESVLLQGRTLADISAANIMGAIDGSLTGGGGNDVLAGTGSDDTIAGLAGDDTLKGGAGDDSLDGGSGADTASYTGAHSAFAIHTVRDAWGFITTVTDTTGAEGTDTVKNVESYAFNGASFGFAGIQQNHTQNLDGGRFEDVLFQRTSTGTVYYQDMTGNAVPGGFQNVLGGLPAGWKAVGSADINGDGRADTLIQDTTTGSIYYLDQAGGGSAWGVITDKITSAWQFMGAGDVNGDGSVDVVIRDSTTGTVLYRDFAHFSWGSVLGAGTGWNTVGVGDFNHDGYSDVAIQNASDGTVYYANIAGGSFSGWGLITGAVGTDWKVVGTGDINGDGYADVVFQNQSNGIVYFVDMAGGSFNHWGVVAGLAGWTVRDVADLNNDGYADVVIQNNADGTVYYANMAGGVFSGWGLVAGALGTDWVVV